jgi:hypothetical protein
MAIKIEIKRIRKKETDFESFDLTLISQAESNLKAELIKSV